MMSNDHNRFDELEGAEQRHDELDGLLRRWHDVNAQRARAGREALMQRLSATQQASRAGLSQPGDQDERAPEIAVTSRASGTGRAGSLHAPLRRLASSRYFRAAASLALVIILMALLIPVSQTPVMAQQQEIMMPDGGRLEAHDEGGNLIGPCALKHTDVNVQISGPFTRVSLTQQYHNPYTQKIEAVYTFPLSHRGAVDRMTMTVGDRVVQAEMKERQQARQIYESARQAGHVASLLEQERPNIFTQSVANIEPNADVLIEISYVEMLESKDGEFTFDFPMVVAPRYMPGYPSAQVARLPAELKARHGVILRGPAQLSGVRANALNLAEGVRLAMEFVPGNPGIVKFAQGAESVPYSAELLGRVLKSAQPIEFPGEIWWGNDQAKFPQLSIGFVALYCDGTQEIGTINADGTGQINNRWFYCEPDKAEMMGTGYEPNTDQVPDASRISPMPVRPPTRAGHDISMKVSIDSGGPAIIDWKSDLHEIICTDGPKYRDLGNKINLALKDQSEIPNRDFVLRWKLNDDSIQESTFVYLPERAQGDQSGFITMIVAPPTRIAPEEIPPRELIFVLDTSGSMTGQPIEAAKAVMAKAIEMMRAGDTFNMITFSGDTSILWDKPRANTPENRAEAQAFLASRAGGGGTEMMKAIYAALAPTAVTVDQALTPEQVANLPADGREIVMRAKLDDIEAMVMKNAVMEPKLRVRDGLMIPLTSFQTRLDLMGPSPELILRGAWQTRNGERLFAVKEVTAAKASQPDPLRLVMFLTDGQVGNDDAIISAVRENTKTTRVFSFGVGNSPNRYLLEGMAKAGRGEVEYVNLETDSTPIVERFVKRIETPVLTNIRVAFEGEGLQVDEAVPPLDAIPDVFDRKPIVIHARLKPLAGFAGAKLKLTGTTGAGPYERTIALQMPEKTDQHSMLPSLWARAKVGELEANDLRAIANGGVTPDVHKQIVALGEEFSIMTRFTSFVAVEKSRLTIAGKPVLVPIPVEYPDGMVWEGVFGGEQKLGEERAILLGTKLEVDEALGRSVYKLAEGDHEAAAREAIRGKAVLERARAFIDGVEFEELDRKANQALADIDVERLRVAEAQVQSQPAAGHSLERVCQVNEALKRVRALQQELKYREALQVLDEVLFIDEKNAAALALRDIITTTMLYREYNDVQKIKELGLGNLPLEAQISMIPPRPNMTGPGDREGKAVEGAQSQSGMIQFPWQGGVAVTPGDPPANGVDVNDLLRVINNWGPVGGGGGGGSGGSDGIVAGDPNLYSALRGQDLFGASGQPTITNGMIAYGQLEACGDDVNGGSDLQVGYVNANHASRFGWKSQVGTVLTFSSDSSLGETGLTNKFVPQDGYAPMNVVRNPGEPMVDALGRSGTPHLGDIPMLGEAFQPSSYAGVALSFDGAPELGARTPTGGMVYPEDWPQVSFRRGTDMGFQESPQSRAVWRKVNETRIPLDFTNNTLEQIENYFESVSGIQIKPDWESLKSIGVTPESPITLKPCEATLAEGLNLVLGQLGTEGHRPRFEVEGGVIVIDAKSNDETTKRAKPQAAYKESEQLRREIQARETERAAAIAELQRIGRLRKVIDRRLWPMVSLETAQDPALTPALSQGEREKGAKAPQNEIPVAVLVHDLEGPTLEQITVAGLRVDDIAAGIKVLGGVIAPDKLDDLALVESVRRIEKVDTN